MVGRDEQICDEAVQARDELEQVARREHRCANFVRSTVCGFELDPEGDCPECDEVCL